MSIWYWPSVRSRLLDIDQDFFGAFIDCAPAEIEMRWGSEVWTEEVLVNRRSRTFSCRLPSKEVNTVLSTRVTRHRAGFRFLTLCIASHKISIVIITIEVRISTCNSLNSCLCYYHEAYSSRLHELHSWIWSEAYCEHVRHLKSFPVRT